MKKLTAGFIQIWENIGYSRWSLIVNEMHDLDINTIIIQRTKTTNYPKDSNDDTQDISFIASVEDILNLAKINNMEVFIGLYGFAINGRPSINSNMDIMNNMITMDIELAGVLYNEFSDNEAFHGWYLGLECWTGIGRDEYLGHEDVNEVDNWNTYYKNFSDKLKNIDNTKLLLISPFLNNTEATSVYENLKTILQDSQIDILALQDSIGKSVYRDPRENNDVMNAVKNICTDLDIDFWVNVESFTKNYPHTTERFPTDIEIFKEQLEVASEHADTLITFDFYHYMNASFQPHHMSDYHFNLSKKLNEEYKKLLPFLE